MTQDVASLHISDLTLADRVHGFISRNGSTGAAKFTKILTGNNPPLQIQGLKTYKVYQQLGNIYFDNLIGDRNSIITKVTKTAEPKTALTIEQQIVSKIELTLAELIQKSPDKVSLSQVCQEFKNKYKKTISETLKSNKLPRSTLNFVKQSCASKIEVGIENKAHVLSLKSS